jgi:hypothetical protein
VLELLETILDFLAKAIDHSRHCSSVRGWPAILHRAVGRPFPTSASSIRFARRLIAALGGAPIEQLHQLPFPTVAAVGRGSAVSVAVANGGLDTPRELVDELGELGDRSAPSSAQPATWGTVSSDTSSPTARAWRCG